VTLRMRRNVARCVGLGFLAVSLSLLASSGAAGADTTPTTLDGQGWWWQANKAALPVEPPTPPNVGANQLWVQGDPQDKTAFSAIHFTVDSTHVVQALTMKVGSNGDTGGSSAVLLACRTGSSWSPVQGGKWETAPTVDDKACINGQRSTDGSTWTFAVSTLQTGGVLDVSLVPGTDPNTKAVSTFSLVFDAPTAASLTTAEGTPPQVTSDTTSFGSPTTIASGATSGAGSTFHPAPAVTPVAPALPADKVGQTATAPAKQAASQPALDSQLASSAPAKDRNKTVGYIVLAFAAAVGLYAWRQDNLLAMNGGTLPGASPEPGGLGRFSRPRQGQPPALT
jgi:hypothetical protein